MGMDRNLRACLLAQSTFGANKEMINTAWMNLQPCSAACPWKNRLIDSFEGIYWLIATTCSFSRSAGSILPAASFSSCKTFHSNFYYRTKNSDRMSIVKGHGCTPPVKSVFSERAQSYLRVLSENYTESCTELYWSMINATQCNNSGTIWTHSDHMIM